MGLLNPPIHKSEWPIKDRTVSESLHFHLILVGMENIIRDIPLKLVRGSEVKKQYSGGEGRSDSLTYWGKEESETTTKIIFPGGGSNV